MNVRKYFGFPSVDTPVDAFIFLAIVLAFILNLVALVSPTWIDFYDSNNRYYSLGLWTACSPQYCGYAWGQDSPFTQVLFLSDYSGYYFASTAPPLIITAQVFYILAVICQIMSCGCWGRGWQQAAIWTLVPTVFTTIAFACAIANFSAPGVETPEGIYGNQAGSATECGAVALALLWTCILCLLIDLIAKWYVEHKNKNSGIKSRQQQTIDIEHHHPHHHHHHQHSFNRQPRVNALHGDTGKRPISTPMSFAEQQARYVQYGATETIPPIVAGRL